MAHKEKTILSGTTRAGSVRSVRKAGLVPAVLYGHGLPSQNIQIEPKPFAKTFASAGYSSLVNLTVDGGKEHTVLIRDIQLHPLKPAVVHVDFYQVKMDEEIEAKVPLKLINESPAVRDLSGVLVRNIDELEISALPVNLPHNIEVDISVLTDFTKVIRISDIVLPPGVVIRHDAEETVLLVQEPRSEKEIEQLSEEVKEDVEAVEGVKKEEPAEEGEEGGAEAETKTDKKE